MFGWFSHSKSLYMYMIINFTYATTSENMLLPSNLHRLWTCMDGTTMHTMIRMIMMIFPMDI